MLRKLALALILACGISHAQVTVKPSNQNPDGTACGVTTQAQIIREVLGVNLLCTCWADGLWHCDSPGVSTDPGGIDTEIQFNKNNTQFEGAEGALYNETTQETKLKNLSKTLFANMYATSGIGSEASPYIWEPLIEDAAAECIKASATEFYPNCEVHVPPGIYQCNTTNCLGQITTITGNKVWGMHFVGAGMYNTVIRPNPAGSWGSEGFYFLDNCANPPTCSAATATYFGLEISDIGFEGSRVCTGAAGCTDSYPLIDTSHHGFRITAANATSSWDQGYKFTRVRVEQVNNVFNFEGDNTASEISHFDCMYAKNRGFAYRINNAQSLNHHFYSTDIYVHFGHIFEIGPNRGGHVGYWGGFLSMQDDVAGTLVGTKRYLFKDLSGGDSATNRITVNSAHIELRSKDVALLDTSTGSGHWNMTFRDGYIVSTANNTADSLSLVGSGTSLKFENVAQRTQASNTCQMIDTTHLCGHAYKFMGTVRQTLNGYIVVDDSMVPSTSTEDFWSYFDFATKLCTDTVTACSTSADCTGGHTCSLFPYGNVDTIGAHWGPDILDPTYRRASDFSLGNGVSQYNQGSTRRRKVAYFKSASECAPYPGDNCVRRIELPAYATIREVHMTKRNSDDAPVDCSSTSTVQWFIGTEDRATDYGRSRIDQQRLPNAINVVGLDVQVGIDANKRVVEWWAVDPAPTQTYQACEDVEAWVVYE